MKRYFSGLRARLLLLVLFAIVPAFAASTYSAILERQEAASDAAREAKNLVQLAAREQRRLLASTRQLLVSLSKLPEVREGREDRACHRTLAEVLKPFPYYRNIGVALRDGTVICRSHPSTAKVNISDRSYFVRAIESRDFGVGDYQIGRTTGLNSVNFGQAVVDARGEVRRVVFAALDLDWLNQLIATNEQPANSVLMAIDSRGTVLAHFPDSEKWVGMALPASPLIQSILAHPRGGTAEIKGLDGVDRIFAFAPLHHVPGGNVHVAVGLSAAAVFATANREFMHSLVLVVVISLLATALAWSLGDVFVLRRIKALAAAAKRVGQGDLSARSGLTHGKTEEIGQLAQTFDSMASSLQRVNRILKALNEGNRAIARATEEVALLNEVCRIVVEVGGYRFAWIGYQEQHERASVRARAQAGYPGGLEALAEVITSRDAGLGPGPVGTAVRAAKPYVARNLPDDRSPERRERARRLGYASVAAFPLDVGGQIVGALAVYSEEVNAFVAEELELLTEVAQDLAAGIALLRARVQHDQAHATIERMAYYDRLTGLPNHALFEDRLRRALAEARSFDRLLALLIVDLTRLRDINDALGFHHGDQLLKEVGARIGATLKDNAMLARMRGDEFAVLCRLDHADEAGVMAAQILEALDIPFAIGDLRIDVSATIGISLFPAHGRDGVQLMRHADVALHAAKKSGRGYGLYTPEQRENRAQRLTMVGELRSAIESSELALHYQPKISVFDGGVCGVEALVRWIHPRAGVLPPNEFIPLAEQTGLIKPLTEWVIGAALRQSTLWREQGLAIPIAVNLSARNLRDPGLVDKLQRLLNEYGAEPSWIEIEITEGAVMEDPEAALAILQRLRAMGIALFIDDFGTGYSSLSYLKKLPVDSVKIDKSFVIDMSTQQDSQSIVRSTVSLGHELNLKVVAEGVQDQTTFDRLVMLGCDVAQGFFISPPLPAEALQEWVQEDCWGMRIGTHPARQRRKSQSS
ncbi:MAG: EAL domain-containing protein [Sulfurifustaceae bacterium]